MLGPLSSVGTSWVARNTQVLLVFAPVLVLTGVLGFVLPAHLSLMSGALPYNVFHLLAGALGLGIVARCSSEGAILFNLAFGFIAWWQAFAGVTGVFPARWFALRPADHLVHLLVGAGLVAVGYLGKKSTS